MTTRMTQAAWTAPLFDDPEISELWTTDHQIALMLRFEAAYTSALEKVGRVSSAAADAALSRIEAFTPDLKRLDAATRRDGVAVPELVRQLRDGLSDPDAIHKGATSQDVIDTATVLALQDVIDIVSARLTKTVAALDRLAETADGAVIMGRTRMQAALPILATHRIDSWREPLREQRSRLAELRERVCLLQLGGPTGDRAALGGDASAISATMAEALGLSNPPGAWHSTRHGLVDLAGSLSVITGCLGKIGQDIALMAQQGIDDIVLSGGGGSSAMAHKKNPVLAELLVTLARYNAAQVSAVHGALVHEQERSGAAWMLEWLVLPQMTVATGASLNAAIELIETISKIGDTGTAS